MKHNETNHESSIYLSNPDGFNPKKISIEIKIKEMKIARMIKYFVKKKSNNS